MGVLSAVSLYLAAGLVVLGEGSEGCPSTPAVTTRVSQLLGDEAGAEAPDALVVDGQPGSLRVRLLSASGSLREQKTLDLEGSCDELADAVATVAVAWRSRLQSDDVPPPVLAARVPDEPRVQQVYDRPPPPAAPPPLYPTDFEVAYGVQTVSGAERWAPGVVLGAQEPIGRGYGLAFTLNVTAPRSAVDPFTKRWRWMELSLAAAPAYRVVTENLLVDTQIGLVAGMNITTSESLKASGSYRFVPPGLVAGMHWTYRHSDMLPWFGVTFAVHPADNLGSPIKGALIGAEVWSLGLALGGTLAFDHDR